MRGEAAQFTRIVIFCFPLRGIINLFDLGVFDGVENSEGEISGLSGVKQRLYTVVSSWQCQRIDFLELLFMWSVAVLPIVV